MSVLSWVNNLMPTTPSTPGSGAYGPFLLYGLNLAAAVSPSASQAPYRDRQILGLIRDALVLTGAFDLVETAGDLEAGRVGAEHATVASLSVGDGSEDDSVGSDSAAVPQLRTVAMTVVIAVREPDADARADEIDRLHNVVANAVNGQSFGGTLPTKTKATTRWRWVPGKGDEQRQRMTGSFTYFVGDWGLRNDATTAD